MRLPDGIRVRGNSLLVDVTVHGVRRTGTVKGVENIAGAVLLREELKNNLLKSIQGTTKESAVWSLKQAYDRTCAEYWCEGEAKSWVKLRQNGQRALDHFGEATNVASITPDKVSAYAVYLKEQGLAGATINRLMSALSKMLTVSQDNKKLAEKVKIKRWKETAGRIRWLTEEEEALMLQTFHLWGMEDLHEVCVMLLDTGMRPSELRAREKQDVDFSTKLIEVWRTKNEKPRAIPMTVRVQNILRKRMGSMPTKELFPFTASWLNKQWDRMKAHIGLSDDAEFIPYCMRHTCCTRLVRAGVPLPVIKEWMGHKSILTTMRYAHFAPTDLQKAAKELEKKFSVA